MPRLDAAQCSRVTVSRQRIDTHVTGPGCSQSRKGDPSVSTGFDLGHDVAALILIIDCFAVPRAGRHSVEL